MKILKIVGLLSMISLMCYASVFAEKPSKSVEKTFEVNPNGNLMIDSDLGSIEIMTHSQNKVQAEIIFKSKSRSEKKFKNALEDFDLTFEQSGNDVNIEGIWDRNNWFKSNPFNVKFIVLVPENYNVNLRTSGGSITVDNLTGQVDAHTSGGSLHFGTINGEVKGKTSGGSIHAEACQGNMNVKTSGGSIKLGKVEGDVIAHTSGGSIKVNEVMGNINAKTSGGSVYANLSKTPTDDCSLKTSGGGIEVRLAKDVQCTIDASTSGGSVYTDFPITVKGKWGNHSLRGSINGGGAMIVCKTSGGGIKILEK